MLRCGLQLHAGVLESHMLRCELVTCRYTGITYAVVRVTITCRLLESHMQRRGLQLNAGVLQSHMLRCGLKLHAGALESHMRLYFIKPPDSLDTELGETSK